MAKNGKYYAVQNGRKTGVFNDWDSCHSQVKGYSGARYKKFDTYAEAQSFVNSANSSSNSSSGTSSINVPSSTAYTPSIYSHDIPNGLSRDNLNSSRFSTQPSSKSYRKQGQKQRHIGGNSSSKFYSVKSSNPAIKSKIFDNWADCQSYVKGQRGLSFKKFESFSDARKFITGEGNEEADYKHIGISPSEFIATYKLKEPSQFKYNQIINVFCDGSALSNGTLYSLAGYGVYFEGQPQDNISEPLLDGAQTNNRAEIMAVSSALDKIWDKLQSRKELANYQIKTDSEYVAKLLNDRYATYSIKELSGLPNGDLTVSLIQKYAKVKRFYDVNKDNFTNNGVFKIDWVKGHAGEEGNEVADELARMGAAKRR